MWQGRKHVLYEQSFLDALPARPFAERDLLPQEPAVYFVLAAPQAVLYVGRTVNLSYRWASHHLMPVLMTLPRVSIVWYPCACGWLDELESDMIDRFRPPLNRTRRTSLYLRPDLRDANGSLSLAWWKQFTTARYKR